MFTSLQTLVALAIVSITLVLLVRAFLQKRNSPGCGSNCGAVSPELKKLQARLKSR